MPPAYRPAGWWNGSRCEPSRRAERRAQLNRSRPVVPAGRSARPDWSQRDQFHLACGQRKICFWNFGSRVRRSSFRTRAAGGNSKFQNPNPKQIPKPNLQIPKHSGSRLTNGPETKRAAERPVWNLEFGICLGFGFWNLGFHARQFECPVHSFTKIPAPRRTVT